VNGLEASLRAIAAGGSGGACEAEGSLEFGLRALMVMMMEIYLVVVFGFEGQVEG